MAEQLYELAIEYAALTGGETVYDLYCGTGTIGLSMARNALTVWGVEISEESVACALENADLNQIGNAAFFAGNVGQSIEELQERAGPPDVVVVDPPRAGLAGKALQADRRPRRVANRLRLLQPDDARLGREGAVRGVRLRARPRAGRSTCSRTRRTSRRSRCSPATLRTTRPSNRLSLGFGAACPEVAPEQVGVREEEAETDGRKRGEAGDVGGRQPESSVAPRSSVIAIQVQPTRRPTDRPRRGRARRRRCRADRCSRCRIARHAEPDREGPNTLGCSETTYCVGPRQTEIASTHGTIAATTTAHATVRRTREPEP